ncbi:hypothetical protein B1B_18879, partial [mine drainage metagenome]
MKELPDNPVDCISWSFRELDIPIEAADMYLQKSILSISGWASWARYLTWQATLKKEEDESLRSILAIRVAWDALIYKGKKSPELSRRWKIALERFLPDATDPDQSLETVLHKALELSYRRSLTTTLRSAQTSSDEAKRADLQAIFCIDVRSEIFRRGLEHVAPSAETLGFGG